MKNQILFSVPTTHTKTRIMATVGPRTLEYETLRGLVQEGASLFRFNGAHIEDKPAAGQITYDQAEEIVRNIRRLRNELRQLICVYFDLGGPKMRIQNILAADVSRKDEPCLHPPVGALVTIRLYEEAEDAAFNAAARAFAEKRSLHDLWEKDSAVRDFLAERNSTDRYELMFGSEVTHLDRFEKEGTINLKDGWCSLRIVEKSGDSLLCAVAYRDSKFEFRPHQGANPWRYVFDDVITRKDRRDVKEALKLGADVISLSFVCSPYDADDLRKAIKNAKHEIRTDRDFMRKQSATYQSYISDRHAIPVFAKIETAFAVDYELGKDYAENHQRMPLDPVRRDPLWEIADRFDGLMVARGDLAVEVKKYAVPNLQRRIIKVARLKNKPVIVATEMLESMKRGDTSTRAEIGDINTAVHQEADILMLSGETASTKGRPEDAVAEMHAAIAYAEDERRADDENKNLDGLERERAEEVKRRNATDLMAISRLSQGAQVCSSARALGSEAVIASAQTGETVKEIAYYRPVQKVIAITEDVLTAVRLLLHRGVYPVVMAHPLTRTVDDFIDIANQIHRDLRIPMPAGATGTFRLPGLIRIIPESSPDLATPEIPNSIHEFTMRVESGPVPEVERKYVLSEASYRRLAANLKADALRWSQIRQANTYFTDDRDLLGSAQIMIRVRAETLTDPAPQAGSPRNVFLTIKGPRKEKHADGTEERPEQEFEITHEVVALPDETLTEALMDHLPSFYRDHISKKWLGDLGRELAYRPIASMTNHRLRASMSNGFVLELDECDFGQAGKGYELEIELHGGASSGRALDDFIHDKFAHLDIPIVLADYPSKLERTYLHARLLDGSSRGAAVDAQMSAVAPLLDEPHRQRCAKCQAQWGT
jgi:pyruvate kinase